MTFMEFKDYIRNFKKSVNDKAKVSFKHDQEQKLYKAYTNGGVFVAPENGGNVSWFRNGHCLQVKLAM